jgi:hypothetical protein
VISASHLRFCDTFFICGITDPGIGRFYEVKTNHLNVCKPWDKESEVYQETLRFIYDITTDSKIYKNSHK